MGFFRRSVFVARTGLAIRGFVLSVTVERRRAERTGANKKACVRSPAWQALHPQTGALWGCILFSAQRLGGRKLLVGKAENPSLKDIGYVLGAQPFDCTPFYNASLDFADKTVKNFNFLFSGAIFMLDSFVNENLFNQSI